MAATLLFHNARLFDGLTDQPRSNVSLVVTGDRITSVEQGPVPVPAGAQRIDLQGKTVVPGLIDTHVHSTFVGTPSLPLFLAAGVTSARDVGGNLEKVKGLKADLNSGKKLGPQINNRGPLLDGSDKSFEYPSFAEILDNIPSPEVVPQKIGARYADFLIIDGDPLRDVRELRKLTTVYRGGVVYDPQALLAQVPKSDFVPPS
jgi:imidazolonepropionase-like amidohydrolase